MTEAGELVDRQAERLTAASAIPSSLCCTRSRTWPVGGAYGPYEVLSWATKFFADALMRHEAIRAHGVGRAATVSVLA